MVTWETEQQPEYTFQFGQQAERCTRCGRLIDDKPVYYINRTRACGECYYTWLRLYDDEELPESGGKMLVTAGILAIGMLGVVFWIIGRFC